MVSAHAEAKTSKRWQVHVSLGGPSGKHLEEGRNPLESGRGSQYEEAFPEVGSTRAHDRALCGRHEGGRPWRRPVARGAARRTCRPCGRGGTPRNERMASCPGTCARPRRSTGRWLARGGHEQKNHKQALRAPQNSAGLVRGVVAQPATARAELGREGTTGKQVRPGVRLEELANRAGSPVHLERVAGVVAWGRHVEVEGDSNAAP